MKAQVLPLHRRYVKNILEVNSVRGTEIGRASQKSGKPLVLTGGNAGEIGSGDKAHLKRKECASRERANVDHTGMRATSYSEGVVTTSFKYIRQLHSTSVGFGVIVATLGSNTFGGHSSKHHVQASKEVCFNVGLEDHILQY